MQKITPHLWFDNQAEEAISLYVSLFENSTITTLNRIPEGPAKGNIMADFQLAGQQFKAIDGGAYFSFSKAVSLFVNCDTREEIDRLWEQLSPGGTVVWKLDAYPWSERYGWIADRFGVSWQLMLAPSAQKIAPLLLFTGEQYAKAEEAMEFYVSLFDNSRIERIARYDATAGDAEGLVQHAVFFLNGQEFRAMEPPTKDFHYSFAQAISFFVSCDTQEEVDGFWERFSAGGEIQQCGWVKDRYGLPWQIVPTALGELMRDGDSEQAKRVMDAMLQMRKLDIQTLEQAYAGAARI